MRYQNEDGPEDLTGIGCPASGHNGSFETWRPSTVPRRRPTAAELAELAKIRQAAAESAATKRATMRGVVV